MATGLILRDAQGNTKQVPFEQLQQTDPFLYSQYVKNVAQPQAQLQETQASTGAAGASAAHSVAETQIAEHALAQNQAFDLIQKLFDANKGSDNKVSPQTYNSTKSKAVSLGIPGDAFDKQFEQSYTNPRNIFYDTPDDRAAQAAYGQTKSQIQSLLDNYNSIPAGERSIAQIGKSAVLDNPYLSQIFTPTASSYEKARAGLSAQLSALAGGGSGSGLRVTQSELDRWANLLPSSANSEQTNNNNIKILDSEIKSKFNLDQGLDPHYLPSKGRKPLSTFNQ